MVAIISITFIILSTVVLTLNTLPYFSHSDENKHEKDYPPFALLEAIYMSWFSFEFLVRLVLIYVRATQTHHHQPGSFSVGWLFCLPRKTLKYSAFLINIDVAF